MIIIHIIMNESLMFSISNVPICVSGVAYKNQYYEVASINIPKYWLTYFNCNGIGSGNFNYSLTDNIISVYTFVANFLK